MCGLSTVEVMLVDEILLADDGVLIHLFKQTHAQFDICDETFATTTGEVFPPTAFRVSCQRTKEVASC
jgi:hypothetical protein